MKQNKPWRTRRKYSKERIKKAHEDMKIIMNEVKEMDKLFKEAEDGKNKLKK